MYLNIANWDKAPRITKDFDPAVTPILESGMIARIDPATAMLVPFAAADCTWDGLEPFYIVFKGTEEQVSTDVAKVDVVFGPALIETDNWNTANAALVPGARVAIEWDAVGLRAWFDGPSGATSVGTIEAITASNNLVIRLRPS